jgi:hypothetical protein
MYQAYNFHCRRAGLAPLITFERRSKFLKEKEKDLDLLSERKLYIYNLIIRQLRATRSICDIRILKCVWYPHALIKCCKNIRNRLTEVP